MFTVKNVENTIIINKSKFITNMFSVDNLDEINYYLDLIKNKYKDATHHCYAHILDNTKRFNDDNEPSGTAGMPILDCLEKNNLNHVLCIITRYFGGIKLGAGGLVRAYSKSVRDAILASEAVDVVKGYRMNVTISYDMQKNLDYLLKNYVIVNKQFNDKVIYTILLPIDKLSILGGYDYEILNEEYIEKVEN